MPNDNETARLAAMASALRPDWPITSLATHLLNHHAHRTYRDVAVALAWIATDPATNTPARLTEAGPWWDATNPVKSGRPMVKTHKCVHHPNQLASHCQGCIDEAVPKPAWFPSFKRQVASMFAMPADTTPAGEPCGLCRVGRCEPGRGICPACDGKVPS